MLTLAHAPKCVVEREALLDHEVGNYHCTAPAQPIITKDERAHCPAAVEHEGMASFPVLDSVLFGA